MIVEIEQYFEARGVYVEVCETDPEEEERCPRCGEEVEDCVCDEAAWDTDLEMDGEGW